MKDTARGWFNDCEKQRRKLRICNNYISFIKSIDLRFKNDKESRNSAWKLRQIKYTSDILKNLDTHLQLKMKVRISGVMWRELFKEGLPYFIMVLLPLT